MRNKWKVCATLTLLLFAVFVVGGGCATTAEKSLNLGERWKLVPDEDSKKEAGSS